MQLLPLLPPTTDQSVNPLLSDGVHALAEAGYVKPYACAYVATHADPATVQPAAAATHCIAGRIFNAAGITDAQLLEHENRIAYLVAKELGLGLTEDQRNVLLEMQRLADQGKTHGEVVQRFLADIKRVDGQAL